MKSFMPQWMCQKRNEFIKWLASFLFYWLHITYIDKQKRASFVRTSSYNVCKHKRSMTNIELKIYTTLRIKRKYIWAHRIRINDLPSLYGHEFIKFSWMFSLHFQVSNFNPLLESLKFKDIFSGNFGLPSPFLSTIRCPNIFCNECNAQVRILDHMHDNLSNKILKWRNLIANICSEQTE